LSNREKNPLENAIHHAIFDYFRLNVSEINGNPLMLKQVS